MSGKVEASKTDDFYLVKLLHSGNTPVDISLFDLTGFSGILKVMKPSKIILSQMYSQGIFIGNTKQLSKTEFKALGSNKASQECVTKPVEHWTDWYRLNSDGDWVYTHSVLNYITYESVCYSTGGGGSTGGTGGGGGTDLPHGGGTGGGDLDGEVLLDREDRYLDEDNIITANLNNTCVEGIIEELLKRDETLSGDLTHISHHILELFNNSSSNFLYFESNQLGVNSAGNQINAETTPYREGWKINLDSDLISDATRLSIAKTIIHEAVHAWINLTLKENRTSDMVSDLNLIYQNFKNGDNSFNLTQHEFMGQYVEVFARSLAAYDNHRYSLDYYISLSWGGLETSSAYSQLPNQTEIQIIIANERFDKNDAKDTPCP